MGPGLEGSGRKEVGWKWIATYQYKTRVIYHGHGSLYITVKVKIIKSNS